MQLELFVTPQQTTLDLEEWRDCPGQPGYEISSNGRCRNAISHRLYRGYIKENGYHQFCFLHNGRIETKLTHRLVALVFLPPPAPNQTQVNHRNRVRIDNRASNLEWVTPSANCKHPWANP